MDEIKQHLAQYSKVGESQVIPMDGHFECIYCGGRWYK